MKSNTIYPSANNDYKTKYNWNYSNEYPNYINI